MKDKKKWSNSICKKSYFFRRILAFEEATRKGSHAKKKKREIGGDVVGVMEFKSTYVCNGDKRQHAHNSKSGDTHARLARHGLKR